MLELAGDPGNRRLLTYCTVCQDLDPTSTRRTSSRDEWIPTSFSTKSEQSRALSTLDAASVLRPRSDNFYELQRRGTWVAASTAITRNCDASGSTDWPYWRWIWTLCGEQLCPFSRKASHSCCSPMLRVLPIANADLFVSLFSQKIHSTIKAERETSLIGLVREGRMPLTMRNRCRQWAQHNKRIQ